MAPWMYKQAPWNDLQSHASEAASKNNQLSMPTKRQTRTSQINVLVTRLYAVRHKLFLGQNSNTMNVLYKTLIRTPFSDPKYYLQHLFIFRGKKRY